MTITVVKSGAKWHRVPRNEVNDLSSGMLMGTFTHNMDIKGRMSFPNKLREILGESFIITKGLDGCLFVYSTDGFEDLAEKIRQVPLSKGRELQRFFMAGACEVDADKQGRILVPQTLREYACLEKDIIVIGASTRAEIWDKSKWDKFNEDFSENKLEEAMEGIDF